MKIFIISSIICLLVGVNNAFNICDHQADGTFFKDYSSCEGFVGCSNGFPYHGVCPNDLKFNPQTNICDFATNFECSNLCPQHGIATLAYPGSCSKYVSCLGGVGTFQECPSDLFYDHKLGQCNLKENVDCIQNLCPITSSPVFVASTEDCSVYYVCTNGQAEQKSCPNNLYFNVANGNCDRKENVHCSVPVAKEEEIDDVKIACPPTDYHFYPHPSYCSHYFVCMNGDSTLMSCGPSLVYDYKSKKCDLPSRASCITDIL